MNKKGLKILYNWLMLCYISFLQVMYAIYLFFFVLWRKSQQEQMEKEIIFQYSMWRITIYYKYWKGFDAKSRLCLFISCLHKINIKQDDNKSSIIKNSNSWPTFKSIFKYLNNVSQVLAGRFCRFQLLFFITIFPDNTISPYETSV
jgi:hypothetical protein